jgi:hypothetical protein
MKTYGGVEVSIYVIAPRANWIGDRVGPKVSVNWEPG